MSLLITFRSRLEWSIAVIFGQFQLLTQWQLLISHTQAPGGLAYVSGGLGTQLTAARVGKIGLCSPDLRESVLRSLAADSDLRGAKRQTVIAVAFPPIAASPSSSG